MALDVRLYPAIQEDSNYAVGLSPVVERIDILLREDATAGCDGYLRREELFIVPASEEGVVNTNITLSPPPVLLGLQGYAPKIIIPVQAPTGVLTLTGHEPEITVKKKDIGYVGGMTVSTLGTVSNWAAQAYDLLGGFAHAPQEGDLVIIYYAIAQSPSRTQAPTIAAPAGFTEFSTFVATQGSYRLRDTMFYKFMGAVPDTTFTPGPTGHAEDPGAISVRVYRNVAQTGGITFGAANFNLGNNPNPDAVTPTNPLSAIVAFGSQSAGSVANFTAPPELSSFHTRVRTDTYAVAVGSGHVLNWETGAVDISEFGGGTADAAAVNQSRVFFLKPSATIIKQPNQYTHLMIGRKPVLFPPPPVGDYGMTGYAPEITLAGAGATVSPPAGTFTLTGNVPEITRQFTVEAPVGSLTMAGHAPAIARSMTIEVPTGSYALAGQTPTLPRALIVAPPVGSYALAGNVPAISYAPYGIQYIGGQIDKQTGRATNWPPVTFSLTGGLSGAPQPGDLVLIFYAISSNAGRNPDPTIAAPSGYTASTVLRSEGVSFTISGRYFWKFMGSTPDTSVTFGQTGDARDPGAVAIRVYRNVDPVTFDVSHVTMTGTGAGAGQNKPNPASITPVTPGALIIALGAQGAGTAVAFTAPAELDAATFQTIIENDSVDVAIGAGDYHGWVSGAYDVAIFGGGSSNTNNAQLAYTLALSERVVNSTLTVPAGSLTLSGQTPTIARQLTVAVPVGSYSLTGNAPATTIARSVAVPTGPYALVGFTPTITRQLQVAPDKGTYTLSGLAPAITRQLRVAPAAGAYAFTGHAPTITRALRVDPPVGGYAHLGFTPTIRAARLVLALAGDLVMAGLVPALIISRQLLAPEGAYTQTGHVPTIRQSYVVNAPAGSFVQTGNAPQIQRALTVAPPLGAYALTGHAPSVLRATLLNAVTGSYTFTGFAPEFVQPGRVNVPIGNYTLTGLPPAITRQIPLVVPAGDYDLNGLAPVITRSFSVAPPAGSYALDLLLPTITRDLQIAPPTGAYAYSGHIPSLEQLGLVSAPRGEFVITGYVPELTFYRVGKVRVRVGTEWLEKPVKYRVGSVWVDGPVKRWNGTAWVT